MKNTALMAIALFSGAVASAQTDTTKLPPTDTTVVSMADTSVGKAYVARPDRLKGLTSETLTDAHVFPALGSYKGNGNSTEEVTVTIDPANKGIVWVEGLPQGRFKAIMKKAPSTYKIPSQKTEDGKLIAEGTLYVNPESDELTIVSGQAFDENEPTSFLTVASKNKKAWKYTGVKATADAATPTTPQQ